VKINRFYDGDSGFDLVYEGYIKSLIMKEVDAFESIGEVSNDLPQEEEVVI